MMSARVILFPWVLRPKVNYFSKNIRLISISSQNNTMVFFIIFVHWLNLSTHSTRHLQFRCQSHFNIFIKKLFYLRSSFLRSCFFYGLLFTALIFLHGLGQSLLDIEHPDLGHAWEGGVLQVDQQGPVVHDAQQALIVEEPEDVALDAFVDLAGAHHVAVGPGRAVAT